MRRGQNALLRELSEGADMAQWLREEAARRAEVRREITINCGQVLDSAAVEELVDEHFWWPMAFCIER